MNLLLLFFMSLIPLATGFLGEHPQLARAVSFYALIMALSSGVFGWLRYRLGRMPEHDRWHIQFRRATLVRSFTGTGLYAAAVIAAPFSPLAATLVFVPAMFNIPMLLERRPAELTQGPLFTSNQLRLAPKTHAKRPPDRARP
jgi:uncharacterized membrane protein